MAKDSLYGIIPVELFQLKYDEYIAKGFDNRGEVRYSLDGTKVLLEEAPEMFDFSDAEGYEYLQFNEEEIRAYLIEHKEEWEDPYDPLEEAL